MSSLMVMLLVVFLLEQLALVAISAYNAMTAREAQKDSSHLSRAFEMLMAQQEGNRKILTLFNKRLNKQRTLIVSLYQALEGAAKGASEEETLKILEEFSPIIGVYRKDKESGESDS